MARIALFYRIYFLYFEAIGAVIGGISAFISPNDIIAGSTPLSLLPAAMAPVTPLTKMLISNIGALYLLFGWNQAVVLRVTKDLNVWRAMLVGMGLSDVGHLIAFHAADPEAFFNPLGWGWKQWIAEGTLILGLVLRVLFLMGVGVKRIG